MKREITRKNYVKTRDEYIVKLCKNKKVLHIGACDSPYTKEKLSKGLLLYRKIDKVAQEQLGIDLDKSSIQYLNKLKEFNNSTIKYFNMNKISELKFKPEVIIFGETIEHIMNLEIGLENLKKIMNKDTIMIITTPNAFNIFNFIKPIIGTESQHPDHNLLFSYKTLEQLLKKCNFRIQTVKFTWPNINEKKSFVRKIGEKGMKFLSSIFPMYSSTLVFVVKK